MALKVIGAGYGRTATLSLKIALERLGFGPCYHMTEVFMAPESMVHWVRASQGAPDWETIFEGFAAAVDFPACRFWRELAAFYPDARVLLSVRDPEKWFESTQATIFSPSAVQMLDRSPMKDFVKEVVWDFFDGRIHDRDFMIAAFRKHNADVQAAIPAKRLLVYEASQGWPPLCEFLGVPVPADPFPRVNSREEMGALIAERGRSGGDTDLEALQQSIKARLGRT